MLILKQSYLSWYTSHIYCQYLNEKAILWRFCTYDSHIGTLYGFSTVLPRFRTQISACWRRWRTVRFTSSRHQLPENFFTVTCSSRRVARGFLWELSRSELKTKGQQWQARAPSCPWMLSEAADHFSVKFNLWPHSTSGAQPALCELQWRPAGTRCLIFDPPQGPKARIPP